MSLRPVPERSARDLAAALAAQAALAGLTLANLGLAFPEGPFSAGMLVAGAAVLLVLSSAGAWLEWNREDLAEAFALASGAAGAALGIAVGLAGLWFVAVPQTVVAFVVGFALAERLIVRSERREAARPG